MKLLRVTRWLFFANALLWVIFGMASIWRLQANANISMGLAVVLAVFMSGNALAIFLSGFLLGKGYKFAFNFALMVLAVNIFLTITDQVGLWDAVTLLIDLALVTLLFVCKKTGIEL